MAIADHRAKAPSPSDSFRAFAERLLAGQPDAAKELLARYSARLVALARQRLSPKLRVKDDPEDVVQSVYRTVIRRIGTGQIELTDWASLSGLLTLLTIRRCQDVARKFSTQGRNAAREVPLPAGEDGVVVIPDRDPTPDEAAEFADLLNRLFSTLPDRERYVLECVIAGDSVADVAEAIDRSERAVYRALDRIYDRLVGELA